MAWQGRNVIWNRGVILASVPHASGVYAIWKPNVWIYIGETEDLQRRLLEHFDGGNPCITQAGPTGCGFELVLPNTRVARQNTLIVECRPVCNDRFG
jgi:hypothetical protein